MPSEFLRTAFGVGFAECFCRPTMRDLVLLKLDWHWNAGFYIDDLYFVARG